MTKASTVKASKAPKGDKAPVTALVKYEAPKAIEPIVQVEVAPTVTTTSAVMSTAPTKADKARAIFKECYAMPQVPQRKDIINRMVAEAGLTKAGAATYLQNMKTKAGLVVSRPKATPVQA